MVNLMKAGLGTVIFFLGYFLAIILQWALPPILDLTILDSYTWLRAIGWFGTILLWATGLLIVPLGFIYQAVTEESFTKNPMILFAIAGLWTLFGLALTYYSWYAIDGLVNVIQYQIVTVMFYIGLIGIWISNIVLIPTYFVLEARKA